MATGEKAVRQEVAGTSSKRGQEHLTTGKKEGKARKSLALVQDVSSIYIEVIYS